MVSMNYHQAFYKMLKKSKFEEVHYLHTHSSSASSVDLRLLSAMVSFSLEIQGVSIGSEQGELRNEASCQDEEDKVLFKRHDSTEDRQC